jgi:hypothetical protein
MAGAFSCWSPVPDRLVPFLEEKVATTSHFALDDGLFRVSNQLAWITPEESTASAGKNCWPVETSLLITTGALWLAPPFVEMMKLTSAPLVRC